MHADVEKPDYDRAFLCLLLNPFPSQWLAEIIQYYFFLGARLVMFERSMWFTARLYGCHHLGERGTVLMAGTFENTD